MENYLMVETERLTFQNTFQYLLIESIGIGEPIPVVHTFSFESEDQNIHLSRFIYVDTKLKHGVMI